jgi:2'-5' RNA ligase
MKRLFISLPIPVTDRTAVDEFLKPYANHSSLKSAKWVEDNNRHITALFLGDVHDTRLHEIREFIRGVCGRMQPFYLNFESITLFPNKNRAKMLWMRYSKSLAFEEFVGELRRYLTMVLPKLEEEEQGLLPHVTLARLRETVDPKTLSFKALKLPPLEVKEVSLYESTLTPEGSHYTLIETFPYGL